MSDNCGSSSFCLPANQGRAVVTEFADLFEVYLRLFSGYGRTTRYVIETKPKVSVVSDGGLYCCVDFLRDPAQSYGQASCVDIGRGTTQINNRIYPTVLDQDVDQVLQHRLPFFLVATRPRFGSETQVSHGCTGVFTATWRSLEVPMEA
jgi:hypothetical protein